MKIIYKHLWQSPAVTDTKSKATKGILTCDTFEVATEVAQGQYLAIRYNVMNPRNPGDGECHFVIYKSQVGVPGMQFSRPFDHENSNANNNIEVRAVDKFSAFGSAFYYVSNTGQKFYFNMGLNRD